MSSLAYQLNPLAGFLHGSPTHLHVADSATEHEVAVAVRSGDFFETLATSLDLVQQNLPESYVITKAHLDKTITQLLCLQKNYTITKKP